MANKFLQWAFGAGANIATDDEFAAYQQRSSGFASGRVPSAIYNKLFRQGQAIGAGIGQFIADFAAVDATDSLSPSGLSANLRIAMAAALAGAFYGQDTSSTPNVVVVALTPAPPSLNSFQPVWVRIANTNSGPTTLVLNAFGAKNVTRRDGTPLQGGDLVTGVIYEFLYNPTLGQFALADLGSSEVPRVVPNPTLHVRNDGSDTNDGSANDAAHAFQTIAAAQAYGTKRFYLGSGALMIRLGQAGSYATPGVMSDYTGRIVIQGGDGTTPANYTLTGTGPSGGAFIAPPPGARLDLVGLTLTNSGFNHSIAANLNGIVTVQNCIQGITTGSARAYFATSSGGTIQILGNNRVIYSAGSIVNVSGGSVVFGGGNFYVDNNPGFSVATVFCSAGYVECVPGTTFVGSASGPRYYVQLNGVIQTGGQGVNLFPGNSAGVNPGTGGQYA